MKCDSLPLSVPDPPEASPDFQTVPTDRRLFRLAGVVRSVGVVPRLCGLVALTLTCEGSRSCVSGFKGV